MLFCGHRFIKYGGDLLALHRNCRWRSNCCEVYFVNLLKQFMSNVISGCWFDENLKMIKIQTLNLMSSVI